MPLVLAASFTVFFTWTTLSFAVIVCAFFTVTVTVATAFWKPSVSAAVMVIVAVPAFLPVTVPLASTVAFEPFA